MKQRFATGLLLSFFLMPIGALWAETAAEKGLRIATEASERGRGYGDLSVEGEMELISKGGQTSIRRFDAQWVENTNGGGSRSLLIFRWPGDIRNTALLTHANPGIRDDQWLYLPSVSKVRRISSSGRSGSFVGSEFAFEDMVDQEIKKFDHSWVRDEPCPTSGMCYVIDRRPQGKSGYSLQRVWFDTKNLRIQQVKYFDRRGAHLKTLKITGYRLYQGKYWRAADMVMNNLLTGKSTRLNWSNYQFNVGVNPNRLTAPALKRIR